MAIGDIATGVFALGGLARGVFALGGVALGLVSFGGLSVGALLAIGGLAVGSVALGGGAVGHVAVGGGAVGTYACGGGAAGSTSSTRLAAIPRPSTSSAPGKARSARAWLRVGEAGAGTAPAPPVSAPRRGDRVRAREAPGLVLEALRAAVRWWRLPDEDFRDVRRLRQVLARVIYCRAAVSVLVCVLLIAWGWSRDCSTPSR